MDFIQIDFTKEKDANRIVNTILENHRILLFKENEIEQLKQKSISKKEEKDSFSTKREPISEDIGKEQEFPDTNQEFEEEVAFYLSMINALTEDELVSKIEECLPFKSQANYQKLIFRIKAELLRNISEIQNLIESEKNSLDQDDLKDFKKEILLNQEKIEMITKIEMRPEEQESEVKENNLFFVPTDSGNIKLLDEMDKVDSEYLEEFKGLFNKIKSGNFTNVKRFVNNVVNGICSIKDFKARVLFDRIGRNDYVVVAAFIQKSDRDKAEVTSLDGKFKNYAAKKDTIKRNLDHSEFRELNLEYEQELYRILDKNKSKPSYAKEIK